MKQQYILILLVLVSFLFPTSIQAQHIPILEFDEFQTRLKQENDTLYVYNFWATWCVPCVKELPAFERIHKEYQDQKVKVVLVSLDFSSGLDKRVKPFVKKKKLKSEVILLEQPRGDEWIDAIHPKWSGSIPVTLIVNAKTGIYEFKEQDFHYEELEQWVKEILAKKEAAE